MLIKLDSGVYVNADYVAALEGAGKGDARYHVLLESGDGYAITKSDRDRIVEAMNGTEARHEN